MLGQFSSGYIADRWGGRKIPLVICQAVVSLSYLASALLFSSFPLLVPYLILLSSPFRGGTSPLTNTMVADFSRSEQLAQSFSLLYLGTNIGGVALGPVAASFLYARSIVLLFAFSSLLIFLSTLLLLLGIPKSKTIYTKETANSNKKTADAPPILILFFVLFALYGLAYAQNTFTLPLQFASLYGGEVLGSSHYALLMTINAVTVLVATAFLTTWTHRLGQLFSMALAWCSMSLGMGCMPDVLLFLFFWSPPVFGPLGGKF